MSANRGASLGPFKRNAIALGLSAAAAWITWVTMSLMTDGFRGIESILVPFVGAVAAIVSCLLAWMATRLLWLIPGLRRLACSPITCALSLVIGASTLVTLVACDSHVDVNDSDRATLLDHPGIALAAYVVIVFAPLWTPLVAKRTMRGSDAAP